ncbi:hypothetical protein K502DRAFT_340971 [Neoconidiobolus thromboides FSU 785]|nr:hypothetical protein K502DRAFT_340971 [Neoconidiobolus thromboides FSU 785]
MAWGKKDDTIQVVENWVKRLISNDSTLRSLHLLSFRKLTQTQLITIFNSITNNIHLTEFYCFGQELSKEAILAMASCLTSNTHLKFISFGNSKFGEDIENLNIYFDALKQFQGKDGIEIDLSNLNLQKSSQNSLIHLLKFQKYIKSLNLSYNQLDDELVQQLVIAIKSNSEAKFPLKIDLSGNSLTLIDLFFQPFEVADLFIEEVTLVDVQFTHLEIINVLNSIKNNTHIKGLGLATLEDIENPKGINMIEDSINVMKVLFEFLEVNGKNGILSDLEISGVDLGQYITRTMSINNHNLVNLKFRRCGIKDESSINLIQDLARYCNNLSSIDLGLNEVTDTTFYNSLIHFQHIKKLVFINNNIEFNDELVNDLLKDPSLLQSKLEVLDLNVNKINEIGLNNLSTLLKTKVNDLFLLPNLKSLEICGNPVCKQQSIVLDFVAEMKIIRQNIVMTWK